MIKGFSGAGRNRNSNGYLLHEDDTCEMVICWSNLAWKNWFRGTQWEARARHCVYSLSFSRQIDSPFVSVQTVEDVQISMERAEFGIA